MSRTLFVLILTASSSFAQSHPQAPPDHVYRAFFSHVVFLNARAQMLAASDPNRASLASYYQKILGLTTSEVSILNQVAAAADSSVAAQDAKAEAIILQIRASYPVGNWPSKASLPPRSAELTQLWMGRATIIDANVQSLAVQLSPTTFARLQAYIQTKFGSLVRPLTPQTSSAAKSGAGAAR